MICAEGAIPSGGSDIESVHANELEGVVTEEGK